MPVSTEVFRVAAELWAEARRAGTPTAAPKSLDGDVLLAAQARLAGAVVVTENVAHLARFVPARTWLELQGA